MKLKAEVTDDDEKEYEFTVMTAGRGRTPQEAWEQCVEHILENMDDFGDTNNLPDWKIIEG